MKHTTFAIGMTSIGVLAGCMTQAPKPASTECLFPDAQNATAPAWVCDAPYPGVAISAVGSREKSAAGLAFMKEQATASARIELARQMKTHIRAGIRQFAETTGVGSAEAVDRAQSATAKLITGESLAGSRIYVSTTSPNGTLYVLVGLDPKLAERQISAAVRTSLANDPAAWQQLRANRSQEELANEIGRLGAQ